MHHMYNKKIDCPVIIRTPMGGRRGYGPTHSQSLERFLIGVDNTCTISLNAVASVATQLAGLEKLRCPVILLENKIDYAARTFVAPEGFTVESDGELLPTVRVRPEHAVPGVTILAYGGISRFVANGLVELFERADAVPELVVPTSISPLNLGPIVDSLARTGRLIVVEEGASFGSLGAEAIAQLSEVPGLKFSVRRLAGKPTPLPSAPVLEAAALPSIDDICEAIESLTETPR
jgi:2-oxoisovalerate dehydrogenase E1 component